MIDNLITLAITIAGILTGFYIGGKFKDRIYRRGFQDGARFVWTQIFGFLADRHPSARDMMCRELGVEHVQEMIEAYHAAEKDGYYEDMQ